MLNLVLSIRVKPDSTVVRKEHITQEIKLERLSLCSA